MSDRKTTEWPALHLFRGRRLSIREIAEIGGIAPAAVYRRQARGVPVEHWADPLVPLSESVRRAGMARGIQIKESRV